jgi:hypothetical protein
MSAEREPCTLDNCGHMRQLDAIVELLGMPRGGISVLDYLRKMRGGIVPPAHAEGGHKPTPL